MRRKGLGAAAAVSLAAMERCSCGGGGGVVIDCAGLEESDHFSSSLICHLHLH